MSGSAKTAGYSAGWGYHRPDRKPSDHCDCGDALEAENAALQASNDRLWARTLELKARVADLEPRNRVLERLTGELLAAFEWHHPCGEGSDECCKKAMRSWDEYEKLASGGGRERDTSEESFPTPVASPPPYHELSRICDVCGRLIPTREDGYLLRHSPNFGPKHWCPGGRKPGAKA